MDYVIGVFNNIFEAETVRINPVFKDIPQQQIGFIHSHLSGGEINEAQITKCLISLGCSVDQFIPLKNKILGGYVAIVVACNNETTKSVENNLLQKGASYTQITSRRSN
jgi:hypothetical protein